MITDYEFSAAVLVRQHSDLEVRTIRPQKELGRHQVFVRIMTSGICGSQIGEIDGIRGPDEHLPHLLGHEGYGIVEKVGEGVTRLFPGDHVVLHWKEGLGSEGAPAMYLDDSGQKINAGRITTFSEFAIVSENRLTKVPPTIDPSLAPLLGCSLTTGYGAVAREVSVAAESSIVILGAGAVGLSILATAKLFSPKLIVVADIVNQKLDVAKRLGADYVLNLADCESPLTQFREILGGRGADYVFEVSGATASIETGYDLLAPSGLLHLVGVPKISSPARIDTLGIHLGKKITGSHGGSSKPAEDIPELMSMLASGTIDMSPLPISRFRLKDINAAIKQMRDGLAGRAILEMFT